MTDIHQETLAPRAARSKKSYVEDPQLDKNNSSRKRRAVEAQEKPRRRSGRTVETVISLPLVDGAVAQVRDWSFGNVPKKDASRFVRAVMYIVSFYLFFCVFYCVMYFSLSTFYCICKYLEACYPYIIASSPLL